MVWFNQTIYIPRLENHSRTVSVHVVVVVVCLNNKSFFRSKISIFYSLKCQIFLVIFLLLEIIMSSVSFNNNNNCLIFMNPVSQWLAGHWPENRAYSATFIWSQELLYNNSNIQTQEYSTGNIPYSRSPCIFAGCSLSELNQLLWPYVVVYGRDEQSTTQ